MEQAGPFDANAAFGCIIDQLPQYILGVYYNSINTGDKAFVVRVMPQLQLAASFMLNELKMAQGKKTKNNHHLKWVKWVESFS
ncbi:MAG: hypothetical protein H0V43_00595 [Gemmatimonadales bacterium]|nr:hypothetical protein [Gemmatimonadales bacterium]